MINRKKFSTEVAGKTLEIETSIIAGQANAAVIAKYGETVVLATAVMGKKDVELDYMPLKVEYEERFYAAGKIIGSRFVRREGKASEEAVLAGRLVDRTIRPLFDHRLRREVQVVVTVLQIDEQNDPEFVGLIAASAALHMSDIPWKGPVAGLRIVQDETGIHMNPDNSYVTEHAPIFDAFLSGAKDRINMIELGGLDAKEDDVIKAFTAGQVEINKLVDFQEKIRAEIGKPKTEVKLAEPDADLVAAVNEFLKDKLDAAFFLDKKNEQNSSLGALELDMIAHLKEIYTDPAKPLPVKMANFLFEEAVNEITHRAVLVDGKRADGRANDQLRALDGEVGLFSRTHGSALFMRGDTQAMAIVTLAPPGGEQLIETMETTGKRRFMLHYNFPPFSVGEIGFFRGPGRREIGHGNLARKSIERLMPTKDEFPYAIRVVSEILSSNGSSSQATVCASIMSLMDAGVPIKKMAAGIAMGLMIAPPLAEGREGGASASDATLGRGPSPIGKYAVLTDIQGPEDHHGDMDMKVAGTDDGVTGMQMDVKVDGITVEIVAATLAQAKKARLEILAAMRKVISAPRPTLSKFVPTIRQFKISPSKIGAVIGPGGKIINGLIEKYGLAGIDIDEDGSIFISGQDLEKVEAAVREIQGFTREFKVGDIVEGPIVRMLEFGAIVDLGGGKDGMIHVSELKDGFVKNVTDVVKMGDVVKAKIISADEDGGKIRLSLKQMS